MTRNISNWDLNQTGSGVITLTGDYKANMSDPDGTTSRAYISRVVPAQPGDLVQVDALARMTSGSPKIIIDYPSVFNPVVTVPISSDELQLYSASFIVPETADTSKNVVVSIGVFLGDVGSVDVYDPIVRVNGSDIDTNSLFIEGSGANGSFVQYFDGRLICEKDVQVVDCTTSWGGVFTSSLAAFVPFEKTFVGDPKVTFGSEGSDTGSSAWVFSNDQQCGVARGTATTGTFTIHVKASGRWR